MTNKDMLEMILPELNNAKYLRTKALDEKDNNRFYENDGYIGCCHALAINLGGNYGNDCNETRNGICFTKDRLYYRGAFLYEREGGKLEWVKA